MFSGKMPQRQAKRWNVSPNLKTTMRKSILLVLVLIVFSCKEKKSKKTQNPELNTETKIEKPLKLVFNDTVIYSSSESDLAIIKMTLIPNGNFDFYMSIYPEPMQDIDPESDIINANGQWNGTGKTLLLNFAKREKDTLDLNALFDSKYKKGNEFKVIDQNTVEIDYTLDKLNIWGIECYKTEK